MIRFLRKPVRIVVLASVLMFSLIPSLHAEDRIFGRIRHVDGDSVDACFYRDAMPAVGETLGLERRTVAAHPKGETLIRIQRAGILQVTAVAADRCIVAKVTHGSAREADWLVAPF